MPVNGATESVTGPAGMSELGGGGSRGPLAQPKKRTPEEEAKRQAESEELERWLEDYLEKVEQGAAYRAAHPPKPKTPEQRQRESTRRRLGNVAKRIDKARDTLMYYHEHPRGWFHLRSLPLLEWRDSPTAPGLDTQMARIAEEAAAGCDLSTKFLAKWQEIYELCDRLRYIRPPKVELGKLPAPVSALSKGLALPEAEAYALDRIRDTHVALNIQGRWAVLPRAAVPDPKATSEAFDWYSQEVLPRLAKKLRVPEDEALQILPRFDLNGRGLAFEVVRGGGVGTGAAFSAGALIAKYREAKPKEDMRAAAVRRSQVIQEVNRSEREHSSGTALDPAARPGRE